MGDNNYIFSLGGYDAEMVEIRNILESKGLRFFDRLKTLRGIETATSSRICLMRYVSFDRLKTLRGIETRNMIWNQLLGQMNSLTD